MTDAFGTPLALCGPFREPVQMLAGQTYGGHRSLHDEEEAGRLGFNAAPIEGPTHFTQFEPLCHAVWGRDWWERGVFSAHFKTMVAEGGSVRAFLERPRPGAAPVRLKAWAETGDGARVLEASASIGNGPTLLSERMAELRPPERLFILSDMVIGSRGEAGPERALMEPGTFLGDLYPFTLDDKLAVITEPSPWFAGEASPWKRAVLPLEMVSVLAQHGSAAARWPVKQPSVGLFADLEIAMRDGPLFVGEPYILTRELVALSEGRRTEGYWVRTDITGERDGRLKAQVLLHQGVLKASHPGCPEAGAA